MLRRFLKNTLAKLAVLDKAAEARELLGASRDRMRWSVRRRFGRVDAALIQNYLRTEPVKKLHIGCGLRLLEGWLNTDYFPQSAAIVHLDATGRFPFDDDTFTCVYCEHMIEHIPLCAGGVMLQECRRVLKPGGVIRLATPDMAFLVKLLQQPLGELEKDYVRWSRDHFIEDAPSYASIYVVNHFVRGWGHQFIYDAQSLRLALQNAGFKAITECGVHESPTSWFRDLQHDFRMPAGFLEMENMTFEATKG